MGDILRVVTLDVGGRPSTIVDLNDFSSYTNVRGTFTITPPPKQPVLASAERRYAGSWQKGETHDNGQVSWQSLVKGDTADQCISACSTLITLLERTDGDLLLEWLPDGASVDRRSLYEIRGTGTWKPTYEWVMFAGNQTMVFDVAIPIGPVARGLPMAMLDPFDVDTRGDYSYDAGSSAGEQITGGVLLGAGTLTTERRAIHTARGYDYVDSRQAIKVTPGTTITGFKGGLVIKRISATTYLEGYVDDDGVNSRVRLDKIIAGARTNLATTNLAARIRAATAFWLTTTVTGNDVLVEHFTASPGPLTAATTIAGARAFTLRTTDATTFGAGIVGGYGRVWVPQHASASLDDEYATPHFSGSRTLPALVQFATTIPGDAPAAADITITHSGGASAPIWALLAWSKRPGSGLAGAPWGILEAEAATNLAGWAVTADATARGGSMLKDAAASYLVTYAASWAIDPSLLEPDDFENEVSVEVWGRLMLESTTISPKFTLSLRPEDGLNFGSARQSDEWGQAGRVRVAPSSGRGVYRFARLGTVHLRVDRRRPRSWLLWLDASVGLGTSGAFGIDYLVVVPSRQRACSPTGVANDSGYPDFISSTSQTSKTIYSDLSASVAIPPKWGHPDHGLAGELIELPPGQLDALCKLSSLVPDDPTASGNTEQRDHTGAIEMNVTPRWHLLRSR
jgi:hypothetical protein